MSDARTWDGKSYDRISGPMKERGREVLSRLALEGDETVLDAGCGSGRITQALIERLPQGRVLAVGGAGSLVGSARAGGHPRGRPARARPGRAGRRGALDGDLSLDLRPRPAVRAPARRAAP